MKNDPSPLAIVFPRWKPALGRLAREAVGMVPTGPRVIGLDIELRMTPLACPKEGRGWQSLLQGILEPVHEPVDGGGMWERGNLGQGRGHCGL